MSVCHKYKKYPIVDTLKIGQRILSAGCLDAGRLCAGTIRFQDFKSYLKTSEKNFNFILNSKKIAPTHKISGA